MTDKPKFETCSDSRVAFSGVFLKIHRDTVALPDGGSAIREYIQHPGAVAVLALLPNGKLLLEQQFRYALKREFIEIPAGKIDPGEDPLTTAQRELQEETGYRAANWRHLGTGHACIGYADEKIEYFLATGLTAGASQLDEGEYIDLLEMTPQEAIDNVFNGSITDSKSIVGLFWLRELMLRGEI
ncbi:MAG: NUDIX hydrolase [Chitinivorax sp.]